MFLVDTNVVSELMRIRPTPRVRAWADAQPRFALSVVTVEELRFGLALIARPRLEAWLDDFLGKFCEVHAVTPEIAARSGLLRATRRLAGRPATMADMLIAATASELRLPLSTRNVDDFEGCGIRIINPFD